MSYNVAKYITGWLFVTYKMVKNWQIELFSCGSPMRQMDKHACTHAVTQACTHTHTHIRTN